VLVTARLLLVGSGGGLSGGLGLALLDDAREGLGHHEREHNRGVGKNLDRLRARSDLAPRDGLVGTVMVHASKGDKEE